MSSSIKLSSPATHEFWDVPVLFEDEHLLAVDKPAGLPTARDPDHNAMPSLLSLLHAGIREGKPWALGRGSRYLMNVQRLDPECTGVLLFAKSKPVQAALGDLFGSEKPWRKFVALVGGSPDPETFQVEAKLGPARLPRPYESAQTGPTGSEHTEVKGDIAVKEPMPPTRMRVDPKGKRARTLFKLLERFNGWALLECVPLTSRPHQVRVHLAYKRLPIAGDTLYGGKPLLLSSIKSGYRLKPQKTERPLISDPILHAAEITFPHPVTRDSLTIAAPWPKDLRVAVKYLRRFAGLG